MDTAHSARRTLAVVECGTHQVPLSYPATHDPGPGHPTHGPSGTDCKTACFAALLLLATWVSCPVPTRAAVGLPLPSFTYYGEISDLYGWPFLGSDQATLVATRLNGLECGRTVVHEGLGPAINYRLELALANSRGTPYAPYALHEGEPVSLTLDIRGTRYPITMPTTLPPVGRPGGQVRLDLSLGVDSDQDGLPDDWELWLIEGSDGELQTVDQVRPSDDFDGDGSTNEQEFHASTDPAWDLDLPVLEAAEWDTENGRLSLAVLTVPGRTYRIVGSKGIGPETTPWEPQLLSLEPSVEPSESYWRGNGLLTWVHLRLNPQTPAFLQLEIR